MSCVSQDLQSQVAWWWHMKKCFLMSVSITHYVIYRSEKIVNFLRLTLSFCFSFCFITSESTILDRYRANESDVAWML